MPNAWSRSVLPTGAASCGQADKSGRRFPSLTSPRAAALRAGVFPTAVSDASLAHALARTAVRTTKELPNHRNVVFVIPYSSSCAALAAGELRSEARAHGRPRLERIADRLLYDSAHGASRTTLLRF